jgi:hypothetical protein
VPWTLALSGRRRPLHYVNYEFDVIARISGTDIVLGSLPEGDGQSIGALISEATYGSLAAGDDENLVHRYFFRGNLMTPFSLRSYYLVPSSLDITVEIFNIHVHTCDKLNICNDELIAIQGISSYI